MKKLIVIIIMCFSLCSIAYATDIDLSELSFEDLIELREQVNKALWSCSEWQEVVVPKGVWEIGKDIPEGHWTIKHNESMASLIIADSLNEYGNDYNLNGNNELIFLFSDDVYDIILPIGKFIVLNNSVIFSTFIGKPDLGFR